MLIFLFGGMLIKKTINYVIIFICIFVISCNICYNLTTIIKNNIRFIWNINIFYSILQLKDFNLLFGTILMSLLIMLFILKYEKELKLNNKK